MLLAGGMHFANSNVNFTGLGMTHGGKREGAGRPLIEINMRRVMVLVNEGLTHREIAERFGVLKDVISCRVRKIKRLGII